ncbi:WW domain-containing protein C2F3.14c [Ophiocordyceps camponoti-floridani]|uniref:WW domain-containing protein C2F3.14c n=1 Tax=Ophiocordyceps camponoti-floridani TaxID=2030778 RepID=A0A8H4Q0R5_9HYPO|nr:WW domain-containing protein C2F3.14c [Ophiocordyceps camponoti-floridani]
MSASGSPPATHASSSDSPSDAPAADALSVGSAAAEPRLDSKEDVKNTGEGKVTALPDGTSNDDENPPLPDEAAPQAEDDGWSCQWDTTHQNWYFVNRFTGVSQWENPRVPDNGAATSTATSAEANHTATANQRPAAGGYNPSIHGDYDPNAWYAQVYNQEQEMQQQMQDAAAQAAAAAAAAALGDYSAGYGASVGFNRNTGQFQAPGAGPYRHSDEAKARRQMNAFFDVDAAANAHDGRSLKAERQNQKLTKAELKAYKDKRRAKKEEKRRAWLLD